MSVAPNSVDIALSLTTKGWKVFPCIGKVPATKNGYKDASGDEAVIREWFTGKSFNVAVACGLSGISVVDADHGLKDLDAFLAWKERNGLPETYAVRTGRRPEFGVQLYYVGVMQGCDFSLDGVTGQIRSQGQYVMAAGSIHPDSGETYQVLADVPLAPLPEFVRILRKPKAELTRQCQGA